MKFFLLNEGKYKIFVDKGYCWQLLFSFFLTSVDNGRKKVIYGKNTLNTTMKGIPHNENGETKYNYFCLPYFLNPWMERLTD